MMRIRRSSDRGKADFGWLQSRHTFSFGQYFDPAWMGYRSLRVINDDRVAPGQGFGKHPHRDMEIVTVVLDGAIAHEDSMGNREILRAGEVQRMTAGTGIFHSEFNASETEPLHLLQLWVIPDREGITPGYEQKAFPLEDRRGRWRPLVHPDREEGALGIHQDAAIHGAFLMGDEAVSHRPAPGRGAWVHVARGDGWVGDTPVKAGDGVAFEDEELTFRAEGEVELLLFDLGK